MSGFYIFTIFLFALWPSRRCYEFMNIRFSVNICFINVARANKNCNFLHFLETSSSSSARSHNACERSLSTMPNAGREKRKKIEIVYTRTQHGEILERRSNVEREERRKKFCLPSREGGEDGERAMEI